MQMEMITFTPAQRKKRLTHLEGIVKKGLKAYEEVGAALFEIKDRHLYEPDFATFPEYCEARNMSERHANRLIRAASTAATLRRSGIEIGYEAQAREMSRLMDAAEAPLEAAERVWREVGEARGGRRTQEALREAIDAHLGVYRGDKMDVHYSSVSEEWYTPYEIIKRAEQALGEIDLDPCAEKEEGVPAKEHYKKEDDGLSKDWNGRVFLNPPYGRKIGAWVEKLVAEHRDEKRTTAAVALLPSRTDTQWYAMLDDFPRCQLLGRLKFRGAKGAEHPAPFGSVVVYLGGDEDAFRRAFGDLGKVWRDADEEGTVPLPEGLKPEEARKVLEGYAELRGGEHGKYLDPDVMRRASRNRARRLHNEDRPPTPQPTPEELKRLGEKGVELFNCDFNELLGERLEDGSVDLVLTDPPYHKDSLHLFGELGKFSKRVLKPDGLLVCYTGTDHMLDATMRVHAHVPWWWQIIVTHQQADTSFKKRFQRNYKPIEVFGERPSDRLSGRQHRSVIKRDAIEGDIIEGSGGDKAHHPWGQPIEEARHLIASFSEVGELVCDPFCGGGTVPAAAAQLGRRCVATEMDEEYYRRAVARVAQVRKPTIALAPPREVPGYVPTPPSREEFAAMVGESFEEFDMNVIVLSPHRLPDREAS